MEERHFLEKASWVAGIISALITLAIWVRPGDSEMLAKQGQETVLREPTLARPEGAKRATDKRKQVEANQATTTPPQWTCRGIANDLAQAFAAAEKINYAKNRNEAFFSLARKDSALKTMKCLKKQPTTSRMRIGETKSMVTRSISPLT